MTGRIASRSLAATSRPVLSFCCVIGRSVRPPTSTSGFARVSDLFISQQAFSSFRRFVPFIFIFHLRFDHDEETGTFADEE
jgi:hypothetical protein